jgi:hypothetical protein
LVHKLVTRRRDWNEDDDNLARKDDKVINGQERVGSGGRREREAKTVKEGRNEERPSGSVVDPGAEPRKAQLQEACIYLAAAVTESWHTCKATLRFIAILSSKSLSLELIESARLNRQTHSEKQSHSTPSHFDSFITSSGSLMTIYPLRCYCLAVRINCTLEQCLHPEFLFIPEYDKVISDVLPPFSQSW